MSQIIGIYKITSPINRIYIGQSIDIFLRFNQYKNINNSKGQIKLHYSLKKYSIENHKFEIIEECELKLLNEKERYWQDFYNVLNKNGLNCRLTKSEDKSGYLSNNTKNKIRNSLIGYKHSTKAILNMTASKQNISKEIREKISIGNSKIILCMQTGIFYFGLAKASLAYNINRNSLKNKLNGFRKNNTSLNYV